MARTAWAWAAETAGAVVHEGSTAALWAEVLSLKAQLAELQRERIGPLPDLPPSVFANAAPDLLAEHLAGVDADIPPAAVSPELHALYAAVPGQGCLEDAIAAPVCGALELVEDGELNCPEWVEPVPALDTYLQGRAAHEALMAERAHHIAVASRNIERRKARLLRKMGPRQVFVRWKSGNKTQPRNADDVRVYRTEKRTESDIPWAVRERCRWYAKPLPALRLRDVDFLHDHPAPAVMPRESVVLTATGGERLDSAGLVVQHAVKAGWDGLRCRVESGVLHFEGYRAAAESHELGVTIRARPRKLAYSFTGFAAADGPVPVGAVAALAGYNWRWAVTNEGYDCPNGVPLRVVETPGGFRLDSMRGSGWKSIYRCAADGKQGQAIDLPIAEPGKHYLTLSAAILRKGIESVRPCGVKESTTGAVHYTNGLYLNLCSGRLDFVATDGHRLALYRADGFGGAADAAGLLLDLRGVDSLLKALPKPSAKAKLEELAVDITVAGGVVNFTWEGGSSTVETLDVKYPPYEAVIPRDIESKVYLRVDDLKAELGRTRLLNRHKDQNPVVMFEAKSAGDFAEVTLSSEAGEIGKGGEELSAELHGPDVKVRLNPDYLLASLKVVKDHHVTLNWVSRVNPVMLTWPRHPELLLIVMPIRMD